MFLFGIQFFTRAVRAAFTPSKEMLWLITILALFSFVLYFSIMYFELPEILLTVVDFIVLACLAVPWHRHLAQMENKPMAALQSGAGWRYLVGWFAIGIAVGLLAILVCGVLFYSLDSYYKLAFFSSHLNLDELWGLAVSESLIPVVLFGGLFCFAVCFITYITLRISIVLPYRAIQSEMIGWRDGWRMTRTVSGAIGVASVLTGGAVAIQIIVMAFLQLVLDERYLYDVSDVMISSAANFAYCSWLSLLNTVSWILTILIGAGTLTQIYFAADTMPILAEAQDPPDE